MNRTQIYLTEAEAQGVALVAAKTGRNQSEVIREAIDDYLKRRGAKDRLGRLRRAKGIWNGEERVNLEKSREDFDRF
jgi:Arc/MetJ-type ribon-helix-helix transcriptional regulator